MIYRNALRTEGARGIAHDSSQLAGKESRILAGFDLLAQGLRQFRDMGEDLLKAAVALKQGRSPLRANSLHALDVVRAVPHQGLVVHHLARPNAVLLHHLGLIEKNRLPVALVGEDHKSALADQLEGVHVAGDNAGDHPLFLGLAGQGPHHVVRLVALVLEHRNPEGVHHFVDPGNLGVKLVRGFGSGGLVAIVQLVAESGGPHVEGHRQSIRLFRLHDVQQHAGKAVQSVRLLAGGGFERRLNGMEGPVDEVIAVDHHKKRRFSLSLWGRKGLHENWIKKPNYFAVHFIGFLAGRFFGIMRGSNKQPTPHAPSHRDCRNGKEKPKQ